MASNGCFYAMCILPQLKICLPLKTKQNKTISKKSRKGHAKILRTSIDVEGEQKNQAECDIM